MKAILLSAGYGTRLYPLTKDTPKALLEVKKKKLIDILVDSLEKIDSIDEIIVVTNNRFYQKFVEWGTNRKKKIPITVLNDFSTSNKNRLGAIGDLKYAIDTLKIDDELFVGGTDMYFDFEMKDLYDFYKQKNADVVTGEIILDKEVLKRKGVASVDENGKILTFEEKPQNPKGNFAVAPFYIYTKQSVGELDKYIAEGNSVDAPGSYPAWLCKYKDVYAMSYKGECVDIGTIDDYNYLNNLK